MVNVRALRAPHAPGVVHVRRSPQSAPANPLANMFVLRRGGSRDAVCDAFDDVLAGSTVAAAARRHGIAAADVDVRHAAVPASDRAAALAELRERRRKGERLQLVCCCAPERCHADSLLAALVA